MKSMFLRSILAAVCLAVAVPAQADTKVGIISLKKVFDGYWKTKQADTQLKDRAAEFDKQRKDMIESYQKSNEEYKKLLDSAGDQAVSTDERDKRKKSAETKLREIQEIESQVSQFDRTARANLNEQQRRMRDSILREIQEVIATKAKAAAYSIVLDTAAESINNTPILVYNNGENEITEDVLRQLNISAPADFLKSADEAAKVSPLDLNNKEIPDTKMPLKDEKKDDKK
jgi:outer membrane protein